MYSKHSSAVCQSIQKSFASRPHWISWYRRRPDYGTPADDCTNLSLLFVVLDSLVFCFSAILSFSNFLDSTNFTLTCLNWSAWSKTEGNINYFIAMNAQPAQQQGEIKFHNYLVRFISFNTMNEWKESQITTK